MEGGLPMLNCLLQHTLRSLCCSPSTSSSTSSTTYSSATPSSKWVYAVFWRILPRNYPPPRWDYGGGLLDRSKGNKRNWILVWEDGFCDFNECEQAGSGYIKGKFGADIFFKMTHEVYNFGEGLMGKVAADNSHKWVFKDMPSENDPNFFTSWSGSLDSQPKAWESQFNSGIQTIAVIAVREGIIQLGSLDKVGEDLNLVINIQRKFSYLHSIPGVLAIQRPYYNDSQSQPNALRLHNPTGENEINYDDFTDDKRHLLKRSFGERLEEDSSPNKAISLGWNSPQNRGVFWPLPSLLPSMSCSLGALLSKLPCVAPSNNTHIEVCNSSGPENGLKIGVGFNQGLGITPNGPLEERFNSGTIDGPCNIECVDGAGQSKLKGQGSNISQSWQGSNLQWEFGIGKQGDGEKPSQVM